MAVTARKHAKNTKKAKKAATQTARAKPELKTYQRKRDFSRTSEPPAAPGAKTGNRFVVQKHDARRLHFDLRLELDGVLKSWAVTKGPSMRSGVRRLAVQTEDHPTGYIDWEGVIPKGQYGGGTMIVWDQGTWVPDGDPAKGLAQGKLVFTLNGTRLKGRFHIVRMKDEGKRHNWLLIKGNDAFALTGGEAEPVETETSSLKSGLANSDLAKGELRPDHKARAAKTKDVSVAATASLKRIPGAKGGILPPFINPSLAMSVTSPPKGKGWIHEIKFDGYRMQARIEGGKVQLLTRKGLDWTHRFPPIARRLAELPVGAALIDGEIIVQDASGHSSFSGLQDDLKAGRHDRLSYCMFDLLHCNGVDLRGASLTDRKRVLQEIITATPQAFALRFSDHIGEETNRNMLSEACRLGLEGIVSKQSDLPYVSGRGDHWQKSKCSLRQEFIIVGFVRSEAQPRAVGSLVLGYHENGRLVHAGRAGTGLNAKEAASLAERLEGLRADMPAFGNTVPPASKKGVVWVKPSLAVEIEYRGWSSQGLLRQAAIKGLREDKAASEIVLEQSEQPHDVPTETAASVKGPKPVPKAASSSRAAPAVAKSPAAKKAGPIVADVKLSHPDKKLWADVGVTKQMLADYYMLVADRMLPHVADRVLAMLRCPEGTSGQCFFAKHAWMGTTDHMRSVDVGSEKPMLAIDDLSGLIHLAQMNVLEIHVWGSHVKHLEKPDWMIFDLDPEPSISWEVLRDAALEVKDRLQRLGMESFVKSTGGKGLHVVTPLTPEASWDEVKDFSKAFAMAMVHDAPKDYTAVISKARRKGKILIDYLRNGRGATAVAPYSTRARVGAPVAMPIPWSALKGDRPVFTVPEVLKSGKLPEDPWREITRVKQKLPKLT